MPISHDTNPSQNFWTLYRESKQADERLKSIVPHGDNVTQYAEAFEEAKQRGDALFSFQPSTPDEERTFLEFLLASWNNTEGDEPYKQANRRALEIAIRNHPGQFIPEPEAAEHNRVASSRAA